MNQTKYRGEVWQGDMKVAGVHGPIFKVVNVETLYYANLYCRDGPVIVKFFKKPPKKRWRKM